MGCPKRAAVVEGDEGGLWVALEAVEEEGGDGIPAAARVEEREMSVGDERVPVFADDFELGEVLSRKRSKISARRSALPTTASAADLSSEEAEEVEILLLFCAIVTSQTMVLIT
ncbi:hypothetical protein Acr_04g0004790 [Actinidia rufa]|uniref:Uncharacterized protein n=1 Tax=Actinidia rufa TaxID=165716 RepID=A0A7J0EH05_9ERIC|nr:hypothetical protein Acr_04g0004790 [Actinidia rufa]